MFLLDDILMYPVHGIMAVFREIHNTIEQESANEAEAIRTQLSELYMMLETGRITNEEFDREERGLLDRLDEIEAGGSATEVQEDDEVDEDETNDDILDASGSLDHGDADAGELDEEAAEEFEEAAAEELEEAVALAQ